MAYSEVVTMWLLVLFVSSSGGQSPSVAMTEFGSEEACKGVLEVVEGQTLSKDGAEVSIWGACIPKLVK